MPEPVSTLTLAGTLRRSRTTGYSSQTVPTYTPVEAGEELASAWAPSCRQGAGAEFWAKAQHLRRRKASLQKIALANRAKPAQEGVCL